MGSQETSALRISTGESPPQKSWPSTTGAGWTGETLCSFDMFFNRLPPEIRVNIWSFCAHEPRVIGLEPSRTYDQIITYTETPPFLQVCRESRYEGLKSYELLGPELRTAAAWWRSEKFRLARILINFEVDTVFLKAELFFTSHNVVDLIAKGLPIKHESIQRLGIHYWGCIDGAPSRKDILKCMSLQKLYMVCDERPRSREVVPNRSEYIYMPDPTKAHRNVLVAGQHCVEYTVLEWESDLYRITTDLFLLSFYQKGIYEQTDENIGQDIDHPFASYDFEEGYYRFHGQFMFSDGGEEEEKDAVREFDAYGFRAILDEIEAARTAAAEVKEIIWRTRNDIFLSEENRSYRLLESIRGYTRPEGYLEKLMDEHREAKSSLAAARAKLEYHKRLIFFAQLSTLRYFWRSPRIELFQQIQQTKKFTDRYMHHGIRYIVRPSQLPKPKKGAESYNAEKTEIEFWLQAAPPWYDHAYDIEGLITNTLSEKTWIQQRKNADPRGKAKRQIMSRKGLARPISLRKNYPAKTLENSDGGKKVARWPGKSRLTGPIACRKFGPGMRGFADAKVSKSKANEIVPVGGSAQIPHTPKLSTDYFDGPQQEANASINADKAIADGEELDRF